MMDHDLMFLAIGLLGGALLGGIGGVGFQVALQAYLWKRKQCGECRAWVRRG